MLQYTQREIEKRKTLRLDCDYENPLVVSQYPCGILIVNNFKPRALPHDAKYKIISRYYFVTLLVFTNKHNGVTMMAVCMAHQT